jgi:hypothetical protein
MLLPGRYIRRNHYPSKALEPPSCTRLLLGARAQSSTDAKDKIFAFHGILGLLDIQLPAPDYSKPVSQIYREAAAASIFHDSSLMLLSSLTGESFVTGLPSWVPDWSNKDVINEAALWSEARATNLSSPIFEISQDQSLLTLRGKIINTIDKVSVDYPEHSLLRSLAGEQATGPARKREVDVLYQWFKTFGTGTNVANFFSRVARNAWTRTHDAAGIDPLVEFWIQAFMSQELSSAEHDLPKFMSRKNGWSELHKRPGKSVQKNIVQFHTTVRKILDRKIMFRSQNGELGIGCRSLQQGDSIALFAGCNLPMIIRRDAQHWRFVSPTYLHKAMRDCPAWLSPKSPLENFTFV